MLVLVWNQSSPIDTFMNIETETQTCHTAGALAHVEKQAIGLWRTLKKKSKL